MRFHEAVKAVIASVCEKPAHYRAEFSPDIRKARVQGFPYNIIFREVEGGFKSLRLRIIVAALFTGWAGFKLRRWNNWGQPITEIIVPTLRRGNSSRNAPALRDAGASLAAFPRWSVGTMY
jgi:hypothetical protein